MRPSLPAIGESRARFVRAKGAELFPQDRVGHFARGQFRRDRRRPEVGGQCRHHLAGRDQGGFKLRWPRRGQSVCIDHLRNERPRPPDCVLFDLDLHPGEADGPVFAHGNGGFIDGHFGEQPVFVAEMENLALRLQPEQRFNGVPSGDCTDDRAATPRRRGGQDLGAAERFRDFPARAHASFRFGHGLQRQFGGIALAPHPAGVTRAVQMPSRRVEVGVVEFLQAGAFEGEPGGQRFVKPAHDRTGIERGVLPFDFDLVGCHGHMIGERGG
jgi:hypothetical protein